MAKGQRLGLWDVQAKENTANHPWLLEEEVATAAAVAESVAKHLPEFWVRYRKRMVLNGMVSSTCARSYSHLGR